MLSENGAKDLPHFLFRVTVKIMKVKSQTRIIEKDKLPIERSGQILCD